MIINGATGIDSGDGDFIALKFVGTKDKVGCLQLYEQFDCLEDAVQCMAEGDIGEPLVLVKLVRLGVSEEN